MGVCARVGGGGGSLSLSRSVSRWGSPPCSIRTRETYPKSPVLARFQPFLRGYTGCVVLGTAQGVKGLECLRT